MNVFFVGGIEKAKLVKNIIEEQNHVVKVIFDNKIKEVKGIKCKFINEDSLIEKEAKSCEGFVVCIGGAKGKIRSDYSIRLEKLGLKPLDVIHKNSYVSDKAKYGKGIQVMPSACIIDYVVLGDYCIVNSNSTIDHDTTIGNGVHVMGGASIAGLVNIEDFVTVGTNATIIPRVNVGKNSYIGAGAVVINDVPENVVVAGVPAKIIKKI